MNRNNHIDNLRGLAMIAMIIIHACSYFLKDKITFLIWNYLQWAVPIFLFCSFYLSLKDKKPVNFIKRLKRIFIPYWIFLIFYFFLLFFFEKKKFNFNYLIANLFLYQGIDFNWLVLLFFYFTFITAIFKSLKKNKIFFYGFFVLSLGSSIFFIFEKPIPYRAIIWLPWSMFLYFTDFVIKNEEKKLKLYLMTGLFFVVFLALFFLEKSIGKNTSQFANKYPPTLLHLSFGMFSTIILYQLSKIGFFNNQIFRKVLYFFSFNSYSLYFIHIIVLLVFQWLGIIKSLNWFSFFILIVLLSVGILWLLKTSKSIFLYLKN